MVSLCALVMVLHLSIDVLHFTIFLSTLAYKYKITIDRFISAPGHGKGIIYGINGFTKMELTIASGR